MNNKSKTMGIKSKKNICRKAACLFLTGAMCVSFAAGQFVASASAVSTSAESSGTESYSLNFKNANGTVNLTDVKLSNLNDKVFEMSGVSTSTTHTVIVGLEEAPVAEGGDISKINAQKKSFLRELSANGIDYELNYTYSNAMNGVAVTVPLSSLATIKSISGVSSVSLSTTYYLPAEVDDSSSGQTNYSNIYANGIYNSSDYIEKGIDGTGMTVAILDTGLDYTHVAFDPDNMNEQYPSGGMTLDTVRETFANKELMAEKLSGSSAEDVYINQKVPFAYDYADYDSDVYASYSQHGTHVAGIVAGKTKENQHYTDKDGNDSGEQFLGVAPEAQLVICKVFTDNLDSPDIGGAKSEDIIAALDDCVALGVDVINMSLGTSAGFSSEALRIAENINGIDTEGEDLDRVFESIRKSGISLMVAASNDFSAGYGSQFGTNLATNPDSGTVGSPSTYDGAMSVASVNGQMANYMLANATESADGTYTGGSAIYYEESRNEDSDAYNFLDDMLGKEGEAGSVNSATFKYVVVPGYGDTTDYTKTVRDALADKKDGEKVIAVVKRGGNGLTFKKKIQTAKSRGADAVIVYNNVSGMIRMSLEDLQDRIPAVSVSIDAGELLTGSGTSQKLTGYITLSRDFEAGPFMNDYSSWGVTPDLQLKPDITSHGGEIISTVAGGYAEMSGTSMACPNLAGFTALLRGELKSNAKYANLWSSEYDLATLTNNIMMSTATTVYDQNKLPYSPRKQGAGLATMDNVFSTNAYLYTKLTTDKTDKEYMCADGRPKAELGEDEKKTGVYNIVFYVNNFGSSALKFKTKSIFMTETLSKDGLSVAEKAHLFDSKGEWKVDGKSVAEGAEITVTANSISKIEVTLKLSDAEKKYLDDTFKNGMFVEGFLQLESLTDGQCSLSLPFMGFYGDWEAAPLLDYDCFQIAKFDKDTSLTYETRPKESIWATQAYSYYWNEKYATPLGSFLYVQDPDKEHTSEWVYTEEEHVAISGFNEYYGDNSNQTYCTTTGIRALYAGLLRNAEIVTYTLTNVDTGEIIPDENGNLVREIYRARKAHSSGGSAVPSQVLMEMKTDEMNFDGNGKYRLDYSFYFSSDDYANGVVSQDTFSMSFYVDYEAPILQDSRIRYQDVKDSSGKTTQKIYLDLDVFDNHYPQAVILCYSETTDNDGTNIEALRLATEYITPVLNPKKNSTNTVTIDVTDFYEDYSGNLFVEVQDYAMNYNVYVIEKSYAEGALCPTDWSVSATLTVDKNSTAKIEISNIGSANASNFVWSSDDESIALVKNGEVFGVAAGTTTINVTGGNKSASVQVTVNESSNKIKTPSISFGSMLNSEYNPVKAEGIVEVNPAQQIPLSITLDPWYYPVDTLTFEWSSSDESLATVDEFGNVSVLYEGEDVKTVTITAKSNEYASCKATVTLSIQDPFTVSNGTLTRYRGWGGELNDKGERVLVIPSDKSITSIGEEAFKDVESVEIVVIPKMVTSIAQRAFKNCVNLKKICFISEEAKPIADSSLELIYRNAFDGCTSLETVDLSNCKVITLDRDAFSGCTGLKEVVKMTAIGTAYDNAFANCTSLESADLTGLHLVGNGVFAGCTSLASIKTGNFTAIGVNMFDGCTALGADGIEINCAKVSAYAFNGCSALTKVTFTASDVSIGAFAFYDCFSLKDVEIQNGVSYVGSKAFGSCFSLDVAALKPQIQGAEIGYDIFEMLTNVGEQINGTKLAFAANKIDSENYLIENGITEICDYAFASSKLEGINTLDLSGIEKIGNGAFYGLSELTSIVIPASVTEIADYAFAYSGLTTIVIPATVKKIGGYAFIGCENLTTIIFEEGCTLEEIGNASFYGSAIEGELVLPATVKKIGDFAFAWCDYITAVTIPAVNRMGEGVFMNCSNLASATFGDGATATGAYTFYSFDEDSMTMMQSSLTSVTLGSGITKLDKGVFAYCTKLEEIDLINVTVIGDEAFAGCSSLKTVFGIEKVTHFGQNAFAEAALTSLNLAAAKTIENRAFYTCSSLESVTFSSALESIGNEAFAGSMLKTVAIPENCTSIGWSAFSGKATINGTVVPCFAGYTVDENNTAYFAEDGVLYEYIGGKKENEADNKYSLIAYPDNKKATADEDGILTYTVIDNTISIGKYAFGSVLASKVQKVVFPYTLKTIGHGAFYGSGITTYEFHSINAPVLLEDLITVNGAVQRPISGDYSANSFFYMNFLGFMSYYAPHYPGDTSYKQNSNTLTINYPVNGNGYDNFVYTYFFGSSVKLDEMLEDDTRTLISMLQALPEASEVGGWNTSNKSKDEVVAFSETVKQAHAYKNKLTATQSALIDEELLTKLTDVEAQLKSVKAAFQIAVKISTCAIGADSNYKTEYRVGETFSLDGLKVKVTYDDYSEEIVDAKGNFVLSESFNRPLGDTDNMVELVGVGEYEGARLSVRGLKVSDSVPAEVNEGDSEFPAWAIIVIVVGVAAIIAAAVVITIFVLKSKAKAKALNSVAQESKDEEDAGLADKDNESENRATEEANAVIIDKENQADDEATEENAALTDEGKNDD